MFYYNLTLDVKLWLFGFFYRKSTKLKCIDVLKTNNHGYYCSLNNKRQTQFIVRILIFLNSIEFSAAEKFDLNFERKVLVASAFAQISFGLKLFSLGLFKEIFIVASSYSYKHLEDLFDGDVNLATKRVNMSWPAIEQGFKIENDALNLCIHELGHAIYFENLKRSGVNKFFSNEELMYWKELALIKTKKIDSNENVLLRDYAGTNLMEFFSVSLETFFERPNYFKDNEPKLYDCMINMFNQNPLNKKDPLVL